MLTLHQSVRAWGSPGFEAALKQELAQKVDELPLQQALAVSSSVAEVPVTVLIQSVAEAGDAIRVKAGIFYEGLIGGCSCANDPTPDSSYTEYCELLLEIDKASAVTKVTLLTQ
jgi:hypothetical protein